MSTSFLKRSLELVETDYVCVDQEEKDLTQVKLINKNKKKKKELRGAGDVKKKNVLAVEKIRRENKKIRDKDVIEKKIKLLHRPVNEKILTKIFQHIKAPGFDKKKEVKEEKTVFTEEDFAKFEKEYFAN